jgi:hypothetical protein
MIYNAYQATPLAPLYFFIKNKMASQRGRGEAAADTRAELPFSQI